MLPAAAATLVAARDAASLTSIAVAAAAEATTRVAAQSPATAVAAAAFAASTQPAASFSSPLAVAQPASVRVCHQQDRDGHHGCLLAAATAKMDAAGESEPAARIRRAGGADANADAGTNHHHRARSGVAACSGRS